MRFALRLSSAIFLPTEYPYYHIFHKYSVEKLFDCDYMIAQIAAGVNISKVEIGVFSQPFVENSLNYRL